MTDCPPNCPLPSHSSLLLTSATSIHFPYAGGGGCQQGCPLGWRRRRLGGKARWQPDKAMRCPSGNGGSTTCCGRCPIGHPHRPWAVALFVLLYAVGVGQGYGQWLRRPRRRSLAKYIAGRNDVIIIIVNVLTRAFFCWCCVRGSGVSTMGWLVPDFGEGGWLGFWLKFGFCSNFVFATPLLCQKRLIILPRIFKSGKRIDLDPRPKETKAC